MNLNLKQVATKVGVPEAKAAVGYEIGFQIIPSIAYPAVIAHVQDVLSGDDSVPEKGFENLIAMAKSVSYRGWALARDSLTLDVTTMSESDRRLRAQALEVARLWLTELLHQSIDKQPMYVHILADPAWKL